MESILSEIAVTSGTGKSSQGEEEYLDVTAPGITVDPHEELQSIQDSLASAQQTRASALAKGDTAGARSAANDITQLEKKRAAVASKI